MTKELKAELSLLIITVVWGGSFPVISIALKYIPPYSLITIRFLLSAFILFFIGIKGIKDLDKKTLIPGLIIGACLAVGTLLQVVGLTYTTPSKAGFITGLNVIIVPIMMASLCKTMPDFKTILGVGFSTVGLTLISINGVSGFNFGDFLTLLCAVAFAGQIILIDKLVKNVDILILSCVQFFIVGISGFFPALFIEKFNMQVNIYSIGAILFLSIFCTIIAYSVQNKVQPYTNPTHAAIIFLAEPVFGAIFSAFIGDKLSGKALIGCTLIFLGMIIINIKFIGANKEININFEGIDEDYEDIVL